jgi:Flp pilus assembly protein TadD
MAAEAYKECPACEARNRLSWEFCVRCGEALHDVEPAFPEPAGIALGPVTLSPGAALGGLLAILIVVGFGGWLTGRLWPVEPSQGPDASNFPSLSKPRPLPDGHPTYPPPGEEAKREGHRLLLGGDGAAALIELQKAVAAAPEDASIRNLHGHALWQQGDLDGALAAFRIATQLGGERTLRLQADLAHALAATGRRDEAIREFEALAAENSHSPGTYRQLGQLYLEQGRNADAVGALARATRLEPGDPDLQEQLGFVLEQSGRGAEAVDAYRKAAELAPRDAGKVIRLAQVVAQEDPEQGLEVLRDAVQRIPDQPLLHQRLGIALEAAGQKDEALAAYREYLRQAPEAPDAKQVAARAEYLEKSEGS